MPESIKDLPGGLDGQRRRWWQLENDWCYTSFSMVDMSRCHSLSFEEFEILVCKMVLGRSKGFERSCRLAAHGGSQGKDELRGTTGWDLPPPHGERQWHKK